MLLILLLYAQDWVRLYALPANTVGGCGGHMQSQIGATTSYSWVKLCCGRGVVVTIKTGYYLSS